MAEGQNYTLFRPNIWVAKYEAATLIPAMSDAAGADHSAKGWEKIENTGEGAVITTEAPMEEITTEENGVIGMVPAQGDSITMAYQLKTPTLTQLEQLSHFEGTDVAADAVATPPQPAFRSLRLAPGKQFFMIMLEGTLEANTLVANGGYARAFGWRVIQTASSELAMRHKGAEGIVQPSAELRCSIAVLDDTQIENTGITQAILDPRFNMFVVENEAA